jgi:Ferritin-like domain.
MSREGFEKLFRKLSDSTWDDAIDLIKYITKRGGTMDFSARIAEEELVRHTWFFLECGMINLFPDNKADKWAKHVCYDCSIVSQFILSWSL